MDETEIEQADVLAPASFSERFGAAVTDLILLGYLVGAWATGLSLLFGGELTPFPHFEGFRMTLFVTTSLSLSFLYYFVTEGVFGGSLGKLFVGLRVVGASGSHASLLAILIRNLIRFVDCLLFPILLTPFLEGTKKRQRFGDLISRTVVVTKRKQESADSEGIIPETASTTRRLIAFLLDIMLFGGFMIAYLLLVPPHVGALSLFLINLTPMIALLYFMFLHLFFQGTPGKLLLGLRVLHDNGSRIGFAGSLTRTLFLPFDMNPLSYLCAVLSSKKQRLGDVAAGTMVGRAAHYRLIDPGLFLITLILVVGACLVAVKNQANFMHGSYRLVIAGQPISPDQIQNVQKELGKISSRLKYLQ